MRKKAALEFVPSHPSLVVIHDSRTFTAITHESVSFLKLESSIPTGSTTDFI